MRTGIIKILLLVTISLGSLSHIPIEKGITHLNNMDSLQDERDIGPMH